MKTLLYKANLLFVFIICGLNGYAQEFGNNTLGKNIQSYEIWLRSPHDDTAVVNTLNTLAMLYSLVHGKRDTADKLREKALMITKKIPDKAWEFSQLILLANIYKEKNFVRSLDYNYQALAISNKINNNDTSFNIQKAELLTNIGDVYKDVKNYKQALFYYYKAENVYQKFENGVSILCSISETYADIGQLDSAFLIAQKAFAVSNNRPGYDISGTSIQFIALETMGDVYMKRNNYDSALYYYRLYIKKDKYSIMFDINIKMADVFLKKGMYDTSIHYAQQVYDYGKEYLMPVYLMKGAFILSECYKNSNEHLSYQYFKTATTIKDSLFNIETIRKTEVFGFNAQIRQKDEDLKNVQYKNRIRTYSLTGGISLLVLLAAILISNNRDKQKANLLLEKQKQKVETTLTELKSTQAQLIQSEKMASLGELTAGIAHEIQNPLNFVNNFSEVNDELISELVDEVDKGNREEVKVIANDIKQNLEKINHHGKRADAIVKNMLQHSRQTKGIKEPTDINALCDEYLRLSYHGMRAKDKNFNADFKTGFDESIGKINIVPQDIGRVLLNLFNNAFYAVSKPPSPKGEQYKPLVSVSTRRITPLQGSGATVEVIVSDNGNGIPPNIIDKIFQPFFTTKPTGQGTGLGLSLAYDIITKEHNGTIKVESKEGEGSTFIIQIPDK